VTIPAPLEMYDLSIPLEDGLTDVARVARVLANAGINIDAVKCHTFALPSTCHMLVGDGDSARAALSGAGIESVECRPVLVYSLPNRPGTLAHYTQALLSRRVVIDFLYQATAKGMVIGGPDLHQVRETFTWAATSRNGSAQVAEGLRDIAG
jgi:hypothetical protein